VIHWQVYVEVKHNSMMQNIRKKIKSWCWKAINGEGRKLLGDKGRQGHVCGAYCTVLTICSLLYDLHCRGCILIRIRNFPSGAVGNHEIFQSGHPIPRRDTNRGVPECCAIVLGKDSWECPSCQRQGLYWMCVVAAMLLCCDSWTTGCCMMAAVLSCKGVAPASTPPTTLPLPSSLRHCLLPLFRFIGSFVLFSCLCSVFYLHSPSTPSSCQRPSHCFQYWTAIILILINI
jgi:hypothetical protein